MKLSPGSTGFAPPSDTDPDGDLRDFVTACHHAARLTGGAVTGTTHAGITPNFHSAVITYADDRVAVLAHTALPLIALAEPTPPGGGDLVFLDRPTLHAALAQVSARTTLTADELNTPLSSADLTALSGDELSQIDYWSPDTVGALLFNHWD